MRVGIYARVSTDTQQGRATIGSQLQTLRDRIAAEGDELIEEFTDDGYSGARLDRPGLDRLRDCLLYTSPSPRDRQRSRMPSSA